MQEPDAQKSKQPDAFHNTDQTAPANNTTDKPADLVNDTSARSDVAVEDPNPKVSKLSAGDIDTLNKRVEDAAAPVEIQTDTRLMHCIGVAIAGKTPVMKLTVPGGMANPGNLQLLTDADLSAIESQI